MPGHNRMFSSTFNLNRPVIFTFISFLFFILVNNVYAHKVYIFAWTEGDMIHSESFSGNKRIKFGLIKVYDMSGNLLLEGKTDVNGNFSFENPKKSELKIVLEAGMGHRADYVLGEEDIEQTTAKESSFRTVEADIHKSSNGGLNEQDIRRIMEEVIDDRLNTFSKRLQRMEEEKNPKFTEIIGGIGYIIGIMGIIIYIKSRKKYRK